MKVLWKPHKGQQTKSLSQPDSVFEIAFGGSRGGGKTAAGIAWLLKGTEDPGFTGLVIRRNHSDLRQWIDQARQIYVHAKVTGKPTIFEFPSGAKIYTGHLKDADAFTQFQGWNITRLLIEELGQIPREEDYIKLLSSVRSTCGITPQVFCTMNPGNVGHQWIKRRWQIGKEEANKAFRDPISKRKRIYIPATIDDNPALKDADPAYVEYLNSLPEPLRSMWRYGDWDVFAGAYFSEFNPAYHVMDRKEAEKIGFGDENNNRYIGIDWGYSAPHCAIFLECTSQGRVFVFDELYGKERHPMEVGELIWRKCQGQNITMSLGDPSMWIRNPLSFRKEETQMYSDASIAHALMGDVAQPFIPNLVPANNNRVNGWRNMAQLMSVKEDTPPNFIIIKGCAPNLQRTIPEMIIDEKKPEDLDTTLEDHAVDACRYALTHIQAPDVVKMTDNKEQMKYEALINPVQEGFRYEWKD
tara:strand:+ start:564 stop:1973 length:1410 start_codon:yes stop_codon:yes gene_type:complete